MADLKLFIPITKVDVAKRLVYGIATGETEDRSGEICDYATTKPFYEKWSSDISKSTDGKSLGNVRAMHGNVAAGKVTMIEFNDDAKQIEICAKVVDDAEWNKVVEGVYTGFSQGGAYVKRWLDKDTGLQRYTADPCEVSLVDLPCLPDATFSMIKADGVAELRKFHSKEVPMPTSHQVADRAQELAKAAGAKGWGDFVEAARDQLMAETGDGGTVIEKAALVVEGVAKVETVAEVVVEDKVEKAAEIEAAVEVVKTATPVENEHGEQVWKSSRDGSLFKKKAEMIAHNEAFDAAAVVAAKTAASDAVLAELAAEVSKRAAPAAVVEEAAVVAVETGLLKSFTAAKGEKTLVAQLGLEKGMRTISRLSCLIEEIFDVKMAVHMEAKEENDNSPLPAMLHSNLEDLCATLVLMVQEETAELTQGQNVDDMLVVDWMACAVALPEGEFEAVRKYLPQPFVDALIAKRAVLKAEAAKVELEKVAKVEADVALAKVATDSDELRKVHALNEALGKKFETMSEQMLDLLKSVKNIEEQPLPLPIQARAGAVNKGGEAEPDQNADLTRMLKVLAENPQALALAAFKQSYNDPKPFIKGQDR
jgi:hypothetical protein